jgi:hypothetical protein
MFHKVNAARIVCFSVLFQIPLQKLPEKKQHGGTKKPLCKEIHVESHLIHVKEIVPLGKRGFSSSQVNKVPAEINPRADTEDDEGDNGVDPLKIEFHVQFSFFQNFILPRRRS